MDFKYTKRQKILIQLVLGRYDYYSTAKLRCPLTRRSELALALMCIGDFSHKIVLHRAAKKNLIRGQSLAVKGGIKI